MTSYGNNFDAGSHLSSSWLLIHYHEILWITEYLLFSQYFSDGSQIDIDAASFRANVEYDG